jgi:hypothetical protein
MKATAKLVTKSKDAKLIENFKELVKMSVLVGVPESTTARKSPQVTNAGLVFIHTHGVRDSSMRRIVKAKMLNRGVSYNEATAMYIHSHGSPLMAIPARPIIEPAINAPDNKKAITDVLEKAGKATIDGNKQQAIRYLNIAGQEAVNRVRAWFTDPRNGWPPNAPSTIKAKGSNRPLINTSALRKSISYEVREK